MNDMLRFLLILSAFLMCSSICYSQIDYDRIDEFDKNIRIRSTKIITINTGSGSTDMVRFWVDFQSNTDLSECRYNINVYMLGYKVGCSV